MKYLFILSAVLVFTACQSGSTNSAGSEKEDAQVVQLVSDTINISGMHCDMCVSSIEKGVNELEGINYVIASLSDSTAIVKYDASKTGPEEIEKAIERRGYAVKKEF